MTAKLRHALNRDGSVTVSVKPGDGRYTEVYQADRAGMRRFAWAVLADLDPEEAKASADADLEPLSGFAAPGCSCARLGAHAHKPGTKSHAILVALSKGDQDSPALAIIIERSASIASSFVAALVRDGLAERIDGGWQGIAAQYRITNAGTRRLGLELVQ